jgi:Tfp pilus assembly protein PilZ
MVREKKRCFRYPLQVPTHISIGSRPELVATSANISEGGLAITSAPALQVGEKVVLGLTLPGAQTAAKIKAEVCWHDDSGRAGMEFTLVSNSFKEELTSWLADRLTGPVPQETGPHH